MCFCLLGNIGYIISFYLHGLLVNSLTQYYRYRHLSQSNGPKKLMYIIIFVFFHFCFIEANIFSTLSFCIAFFSFITAIMSFIPDNLTDKSIATSQRIDQVYFSPLSLFSRSPKDSSFFKRCLHFLNSLTFVKRLVVHKFVGNGFLLNSLKEISSHQLD